MAVTSVTLLSIMLLVSVTLVMSNDSVTEQRNITPQYMNQGDIVTSDSTIQHVQTEAPLLSNRESIIMKTITRTSASTQLESGWCITITTSSLYVKIVVLLNISNVVYFIFISPFNGEGFLQ